MCVGKLAHCVFKSCVLAAPHTGAIHTWSIMTLICVIVSPLLHSCVWGREDTGLEDTVCELPHTHECNYGDTITLISVILLQV